MTAVNSDHERTGAGGQQGSLSTSLYRNPQRGPLSGFVLTPIPP